jgi:hypothetical protein
VPGAEHTERRIEARFLWGFWVASGKRSAMVMGKGVMVVAVRCLTLGNTSMRGEIRPTYGPVALSGSRAAGRSFLKDPGNQGAEHGTRDPCARSE